MIEVVVSLLIILPFYLLYDLLHLICEFWVRLPQRVLSLNSIQICLIQRQGLLLFFRGFKTLIQTMLLRELIFNFHSWVLLLLHWSCWYELIWLLFCICHVLCHLQAIQCLQGLTAVRVLLVILVLLLFENLASSIWLLV